MKKLVVILTAILLCLTFALAACGKTGGNGGNRGNDGSGETAATETLTFSQNEERTGYIVTGDSGQTANIVIPAEYDGKPVVAIADSAFAYSKHKPDIVSVTIPDSVTEIGKNAFYARIDDLINVNIGTHSKLKTIGNNAFSGCRALTSVYIPEGVEKIGDLAFNNCGSLNTITVAVGNAHYSGEGNCLIDIETNTIIRGSNRSVIPETVTKIGVAAFRRATVTTLTIPKSVTSIEKYAISDSAITKIVYYGTSEEWDTLIKSSSKYWNMGNENVEIVCADTQTSNILVAYFSCTNNTERVAGYIAEATGGDRYEIVPEVPYTNADIDYGSASSRTYLENNDPDTRPAISGRVEDMEKYNVVFLGYPIWYGNAPKNYTFLESYNFSGKTIIPFCTSASSPMGASASNLHKLTNGADWQAGMRFSATVSQSNVFTWLNGLEY